MKELSIEEKAKAYDFSLNRAKRLYEQGTITESLSYVFPQLKKLGDEEVRKEIMQLFRGMYEADPRKERWLAWLEKQGKEANFLSKIQVGDIFTRNEGGELVKISQLNMVAKKSKKQGEQNPIMAKSPQLGEQKPADKVKPKFKVGDWITNGAEKPSQISSIEDDMYYTHNGTIGGDIESMDKEYHLWTIQDAKEGDVLVNDHHILILKELDYDRNGTPSSVKAYCDIDPNGNFEIGKDGWGFCITLHIHPATNEQWDTLFAKMREAGYEWDAEKKELKKIEESENIKNQIMSEITDLVKDYITQKPTAWSEEDEKMRKKALLVISDDCGVSDYEEISDWLKSLKSRVQPKQEWSEEDTLRFEEVICMIEANGRWVRSDDAVKSVLDWLKSLEQRYAWKPSEKQMEALHDMNLTGNISYTGQAQELIDLYKDLKKLREE